MTYKLRGAIKRNYGGGGGGGSRTTTTDTIPEWARPAIQDVQATTKSLYESGNLDNVAGASNLQQEAFTTGAEGIRSTTGSGINALSDQQARLAAAAKSGGYDTTALKNKAILQAGQKTAALGNQYGAGGTLGSGRQAVQQGSLNAATAAEFATIDQKAAQQAYENKMAAEKELGSSVTTGASLATGQASGLSNLGGQQRTIEQQIADQDWQGLQRYASTIYGNPARQQTTNSGGGGK